MKKIICAGAVLFSLSFIACVPARKFQDEKAKADSLYRENQVNKQSVQELQDELKSAYSDLEEMTTERNKLSSDTAGYGVRYRNIEKLNHELQSLYEKLLSENQKLLSTSTSEKQSLSEELSKKADELNQKELQLKDLETKLNEKQGQVNSLSADLEARQKKVQELEQILTAKDSAAKAIKDKISKALLGFEGTDLTVTQKNGKVYVSMSENLLFKSGSTSVDQKGKDALKKLAEVLNKNTDINIMVEGHTDNVPLSGTGTIKDNWDLSVLRATTITKILTADNGVDPKRITSAGHGEFFPVDDNSTKEGRAKNRRTEIILTPKLDELLKVLGAN